MMADYHVKSVKDGFPHLLKLISSRSFLEKKGLGNEVPFFICPFDPAEAVEMEKMQKQLFNKLRQKGVQPLVINLYDLIVDILKKRGIWEQVLEKEESVSKDQLMELLQGVLDSETHLVPAIAGKMKEVTFAVMFITGVGEVFPYIRSHNVLNNLQSTAQEQPTVMFFPGTYIQSLEEGASLRLFGRLSHDKYYRAFNIYHCEI